MTHRLVVVEPLSEVFDALQPADRKIEESGTIVIKRSPATSFLAALARNG